MLRFRISYTTDFNTESWLNPWTGELIQTDKEETGLYDIKNVPLDQFLFYEDFAPNTAAVTFEIYDENNNQVFFFDLFIETDEKQNIGNLSISEDLKS